MGVVFIETKAKLAQFQRNFQLELSLAIRLANLGSRETDRITIVWPHSFFKCWSSLLLMKTIFKYFLTKYETVHQICNTNNL